jgi:flagellar biosynthesis/type III secretory pathway chaperone
VDRGASRECLASLLSEEAEQLRGFEALLEQEHQALRAKDMARIDSTARLRQDRLGTLARIESQRRSLCTMHGHSGDKVGLEALMGWCDPEGSLLAVVRTCAERATRCRDLNDRNGTLVAALLKHVERRLSGLRGESNISVIYGPQGSVAGSQVKRVLGAA